MQLLADLLREQCVGRCHHDERRKGDNCGRQRDRIIALEHTPAARLLRWPVSRCLHRSCALARTGWLRCRGAPAPPAKIPSPAVTFRPPRYGISANRTIIRPANRRYTKYRPAELLISL